MEYQPKTYVVLEHLTMPDRGRRFWSMNGPSSSHNVRSSDGEVWYKEVHFTDDENEAIEYAMQTNFDAVPSTEEFEEHVAEKFNSKIRVLEKANSLADMVKTKEQADEFMTQMRMLDFRTETDDSGGYHKVKIPKGELGNISKVREEFLELWDAHSQGNPVMVICEMCDIIGAIEALAEKYNLTLEDLVKMMRATQRAFKNGRR